MSQTVICPRCQSPHLAEEPQDEHPSVIWCPKCHLPLKLGAEAEGVVRSVKILWIDDDRLLLTLGSETLGRLGYQILSAADGPSGVEMAKREGPDLIILDVLMPNMDGYEICRRLRAEPGLQETPILLLTALEERMVDLWGREAGATFTMSKPSHPERIISIIEWMLGYQLEPPGE